MVIHVRCNPAYSSSSASSVSKPAKTFGFKSTQSLPLFLLSYHLVTPSSRPTWNKKVVAKIVATKVEFLLKTRLKTDEYNAMSVVVFAAVDTLLPSLSDATPTRHKLVSFFINTSSSLSLALPLRRPPRTCGRKQILQCHGSDWPTAGATKWASRGVMNR